jgi:DNA-binding beta-propeller fold protein YncE
VGLLVVGLVLALPAVAWAIGELTQKPGTTGCVSEDGTGGVCQDGKGLGGALAVVSSPDGRNVYVASNDSEAVAIFDRGTAGDLSQKAGTAGCVSNDGTGGACQDGTAVEGEDLAISPDGKNVYVASFTSGAVAVLDRNTVTGELTQKPGMAGCVSDDGTGGACVDGTALKNADGVVVSQDGKNVYGLSNGGPGAIAIFDRDAGTGGLTQKPGMAGCISDTGSGCVCQVGRALPNPQILAISPDGRSLYVVSGADNAVAIFDRDTTTGELLQKPGTAGCVSDDGSGGACQDGTALAGARGVAVSPDSKNVYVAAPVARAVAAFDRSASGALTQKPGTDACVSEDGTGGACQDGHALLEPLRITVSPDGRSVYVASRNSDAVTILDRSATTGALSQEAGTAGCVSEDGTAGTCQDGKALDTAFGVGVSPDDKNVYVASAGTNAVAIFDRATLSAPAAGPLPTAVASISRLSVSPRAFRAANRGASIARARKRTGTRISYVDSQPASTTFTVLKRARGVRRGARCVKPPRRPTRGGKRCSRYVKVGSFRHVDKAGKNQFRFTGRVRHHKLPPSRYRMRAVPRLAGQSGQARTASFRIVR